MVDIEKPTESQNVPSEKHQQDINDLPVEVKANEQNYHSGDSNEDISEESINFKVRAGFIRKVYGILSLQLIITFGAVLLFQNDSIKSFIMSHHRLAGNLLIFSSLTFILLFLILACNRSLSRRVPYNYLFLFAITTCEAFLCAIVSSTYSFQIVSTALALTIISTLAITFYAWNTKTNFSIYRMVFLVGFSQVVMLGFIAFLFRIEALYTAYTFAMTFIVGMYLVYDTQLILGKFGKAYSVDDYIFATLEIYMDIVRLFLLILRILSKLNRRN